VTRVSNVLGMQPRSTRGGLTERLQQGVDSAARVDLVEEVDPRAARRLPAVPPEGVGRGAPLGLTTARHTGQCPGRRCLSSRPRRAGACQRAGQPDGSESGRRRSRPAHPAAPRPGLAAWRATDL
jgi:hypothetical protein